MWFTKHGWAVWLLAPDDGPGPGPSVHWSPVPVVHSARNTREVLAAVRAVRRHKQREPDAGVITHVHGLRSLLVARLAGIGPPLVTVHGVGSMASDPVGYAQVRRAWLSMASKLASHAISVCPGLPSAWMVRLHASPLLAELETAPFPSASTVPTFGWLGALQEPKQPEVFVRAIAQVAASGQPVRGLLGGTGPRTREIQRLIADLRAPVTVLGDADPVALLRESWALVLLSGSEGTPFSVMEAMWGARSVIASPLVGIKHLVGPTGLFVDDVSAAAAAIMSVATDHQRAADLGEAAAARIRGLVAPDDPWPDIELLYLAHLRRPLERTKDAPR